MEIIDRILNLNLTENSNADILNLRFVPRAKNSQEVQFEQPF